MQSQLVTITWIGIILAIFSGSVLFLLQHRQLTLIALAGQYAGLFLLTSLSLPLSIASVKWITGLIVIILLASTERWLGPQVAQPATKNIPSDWAFRIIALALSILASLAWSRETWVVVPEVTYEARLGAALFIATGLLSVGLTDSPLRIGVGLLTVLCGFEVVYATIEPSLSVLALLSLVHMGIVLVVSQLMFQRARSNTDLEEQR